jgi:hypothetical protein
VHTGFVTVPDTSIPGWQLHVRLPDVFVHLYAPTGPHSPLLTAHSSTSVQANPSPSYPAGQAQEVFPEAKVHFA